MHLDLLYDVDNSNCSTIGSLCYRVNAWLVRHIEAQLIYRERRYKRDNISTDEIRTRLKARVNDSYLPPNVIKPVEHALRNLLEGIVRFLIPSNLESYYSEVFPNNRSDVVCVRLNIFEDGFYNPLDKVLNDVIETNSNNLSPDRLHEIEMLRQYTSKSKAKTVIASIEQFVIRDTNGKDIDDWDGVVIEIYENHTTVTILEAKNTTPQSSRANKAFKQLKDTQHLIKSKHKELASRRHRVGGLGAYLKFTL